MNEATHAMTATRWTVSKLKPEIAAFFDKDTSTFSYVVSDPSSTHCAVIDSVMELDYASGNISHNGADSIIAYIQRRQLAVQWLIETHVHADHLSAAPYIQEKLGGRLAIGNQITRVQEVFGTIFNASTEFARDGSQFDHLFQDNERYTIGNLECQALHTPGHTPACMTHLIGDAAFVGDTLFMPDVGTARADFPGGDARELFRSIQRVLSLPPDTRLFMCHDYPQTRAVEYQSSVALERTSNIHVHAGISEDAFVKRRETRDATLGMPRLILPSLQVNMRAGHLPPADENGTVYLKVPLNAFKNRTSAQEESWN
jgi:glyoxylase-like metal-dependent hydrolase (beta-lactamase superfamily II)